MSLKVTFYSNYKQVVMTRRYLVQKPSPKSWWSPARRGHPRMPNWRPTSNWGGSRRWHASWVQWRARRAPVWRERKAQSSARPRHELSDPETQWRRDPLLDGRWPPWPSWNDLGGLPRPVPCLCWTQPRSCPFHLSTKPNKFYRQRKLCT